MSDDRRLYSSRSPTGRDGKKGDRSRCLGRSRDCLATKIHAVVDKQARPIKLKLTASLDADITSAPEMITDFSEGAILQSPRLQREESTRDPRGRRLTLIRGVKAFGHQRPTKRHASPINFLIDTF